MNNVSTHANRKPSILLADDERGTREALARFLRPSYAVTLAEDGEAALNLISRNDYDLVLSDIRMPGADGFAILEKTLAKPEPPPCILFTSYGSIETAVEAMKKGAFDFVQKPVVLDRLEILIGRALESKRMKQENRELKKRLDDKFGVSAIVGESDAIRKVIDTVKLIAPSRTTVLIEGESGTGKELVAQSIHQLSGRKGKFIPVHCAALPETLLESELFGHEKGAFTGAVEDKAGRFELADGGTIFLDEIGEIPLSVQVKLLRVLETRSFERVGGIDTITSDVRVVAATNRDLAAMVTEGTFREDLFYRLDVVRITIPPLRERPDDVPRLARHFLKVFADENARGDMTTTEDVIAALRAYPWPGNIRELKNCMERMVVLCRGNEINVSNVPRNILEKSSEVKMTPLPDRTGTVRRSSAVPEMKSGDCDLEHNEKMLIERALAECGGNRSRAAERLGISRRTLHRKLHTYNID